MFMLCLQKDSWGLDFYNGTEIKKDSFGQYSTDVFTAYAADLIRNHDESKVIECCFRSRLFVLFPFLFITCV